MQDYAIIKIGPHQYIVEPGKTYTVEKFPAEVGTKVSFDILALSQKDKLEVGKPVVEKAKVELEILDQGKGEKVVTRQFRAKSRYRRTRGFRKQVTTFKVVSIK